VLLLLPYYALTFIGPREARTGDPLEKDLTAAFATNAETKVLVINDLFFFVAFDIVVIPALRLPAKNELIAAPASV
jgi:hypothetical protein